MRRGSAQVQDDHATVDIGVLIALGLTDTRGRTTLGQGRSWDRQLKPRLLFATSAFAFFTLPYLLDYEGGKQPNLLTRCASFA